VQRVIVIALLAGACAEERGPAPCNNCSSTMLHPPGWLDPQSHAFHGKDLERRGWDFALCQSCHGKDFAGTSGAPSCLTCHAKAPTACDTCHGQPPATGAHAAHGAQAIACGECHVVPATWDEPGHILDENRKPIAPPARVTFGLLANRDVTPSRRTAPPTWDPDSGTCANVYCHGGTLGDPAAAHASPAWNGGPPQVVCGSCHGNPPANHAQSECAMCHPGSGSGTPRHIDGKIDVGDGSGPCSGCHGDARSPAPPRGLHGETATSTLAVGAHRAHLVAGTVRGPIACGECHVVPSSVGDAGHIDRPLPAALEFGPLATADGAAPTWNRSTATCANVYCHGGGSHLLAEPSAGKLVMQTWTASADATIYCGACHGLPPVDLSHAPTLQLTDCATCHPGTVGPFGNILVGNGKHINGVVDLQ
jgi:predicted CxxxxCH...CXXCH cytochrome family protein